MQYRPKRDNKNAYILSGTLVGCAAICAVSVILGIGFDVINETLLLAFITAALYVLIRHVLFDYVYHVRDDGFLDIVKVTSNVPAVILSIRMSGRDVVEKDDAELKEKYPDAIKKGRYDLTLRSKNNYRYIYEADGKRYYIVIEADEKFIEYLRGRISEIGGVSEENNEEED